MTAATAESVEFRLSVILNAEPTNDTDEMDLAGYINRMDAARESGAEPDCVHLLFQLAETAGRPHHR